MVKSDFEILLEKNWLKNEKKREDRYRKKRKSQQKESVGVKTIKD